MKLGCHLCCSLWLTLLFADARLNAVGAAPQPTTYAAKKIQPKPNPTKKKIVRKVSKRVQAAQSHCGDNPPTNPSHCTINERFEAGCTLPFQNEVSHEVDAQCPIEGCATRASDKAQNRIKNNLCATGTPVQLSFASFDKLQRAVDRLVLSHQISYGSTGPPQPSDRAKLHGIATQDANGSAITLSEGDLVTLEAFVLDAKHDDTFPFGFGGEGVNCKNSLLEWNDIHVALGQTATSRECSSVTAEIIPHFRPAVWERFDSNTCTKPHVTKPLPVKGLRVRLTGQLFFDGSHKPTPCNATPGSGNPLRRAVWEIHPVYKIEVFDGGSLISFEDWAARQSP